MPDRIAALVQFLQGTPEVTALTGQRIFADELSDAVVPRMPLAAVVIRSSGGAGTFGSRSFAEYSDSRVDIRHYGFTPASARDLYNVVFGVLKQMPRTVVGDTLLHWCNPAGGPNAMRDRPDPFPEGAPPDNTVHWPFVVASWQVMAADVPVPA